MNLKYKENIQNALSFYADEVMEWKEYFNLTASKDKENFFKFHIDDSLLPLKYIQMYVNDKLNHYNSINFADLGTGAGLPLIPLALLLNDYNIDFYAVERNHKRVIFLNQLIKKLNNENYINNKITVNECDIKDIKNTRFDIVVFRAFRQFCDIEKDISKILKDDGVIFAYKGEIDKTENELKLLKYLDGKIVNLGNIDGHKRCLMILKKR